MSLARVGHEAPDFEATPTWMAGSRTSSCPTIAGKWVVLCFYPGDFTFV